MNIAIDVGNSRTKIAHFKEGKLVHRDVIKKLKLDYFQSLFKSHKIEHAILSSVAERSEEVEAFLSQQCHFIVLDHETPLPYINQYKSPETLGKDRIAAVAGAHHLYPESNCLVIDVGTCITLDFLNKEGVYFGGTITPGIRLRYQAMHHFTARLPLVKRQRLDNFIGYNTETCIRSGAQEGSIMEIQGFIRRYEEVFGEINTIMTGGDTEYFVSQLKSRIFAHPNLVLEGLNQILAYNVNKPI